MHKILYFPIFLLAFFCYGQTFTLKDSISFTPSDSYTFQKADIFNSVYYTSKKEKGLVKHDKVNNKTYYLKNFAPSKRLFIINPLFLVIWDEANKKVEFYDDKFIKTQDNLSILNSDIVNSELIYIQDNKVLTYFDDYNTRKFIQYDYRKDEKIFYSNAIDNKLLVGYLAQEVYIFKQSKFLLLSSEEHLNYRIIKFKMNGESENYDIPLFDYHFWNEDKFVIIDKENIIIYDFENSPISIKLPQKGESYFILGDQLFLENSNTVYIYQLKN